MLNTEDSGLEVSATGHPKPVLDTEGGGIDLNFGLSYSNFNVWLKDHDEKKGG